ncbi:MAG: hypothetical protein MR332_03730 [Fusicatenibacter sp.]|nr:hypothetical protein [Fusicatenibacter sp.]
MSHQNIHDFFRIGDFFFELSYPTELTVPPHFRLFQVSTSEGLSHADYCYTITCAPQLPQLDWPVTARREDLCVMRSPVSRDDPAAALEGRLIGVKGTPGYYASYREHSGQEAEITLLQDRLGSLNFDPVFTSLLALEKRMLQQNSLILHCSHLQYQGQGILFSGPSGIGKSTQARLWETYRGAKTLNGDRALLRLIHGKWFACGWPVCGSSEICHTGDSPIHAVVILQQGKENHIRKLSPLQAFTQLYSQITLNGWDYEAVQHGTELLEKFITSVPVYQLTCTISEDAVFCLENVIFPPQNAE